MRRSFAAGATALAILTLGCPPKIPLEEKLPAPPPLERGMVDEGALGAVRRPSRLTANPEQEYDPAPSPDGGVLAYVSHAKGNADVFLRFLPGSGRVGEYPVVAHYAADSDPTWSPNGRQVAFISKRDDPKGDLYIYNVSKGSAVPDAIRDAVLAKFGDALSLPETGMDPAQIEQLTRVSEFLEKRDPVIRLSDAEREDRGPAWSHDGKTIWYAARKPGEPENVWSIDLKSFDSKQVTTEGGFDPAPSPDGKYLVYASRAADANGGLRVRRLEDGATASVTDDASIDGFPSFGEDGKQVFFSRYAYDTNEDGKIDVNDRPQIFALPFAPADVFAKKLATPWPMTPEGGYDLFPAAAGGRLFYSSDDGTNTDIWAIPETGIFPALSTPADELALADALAGEPAYRLLLLDQMVAKRPAEDPAVQDARLAAARLRADRRELSAALTQAKAIAADPKVTGARHARAQILALRIAALAAEHAGPGGTADKAALRSTADKLDALAASLPKESKAEALLEAGNSRAGAGDKLAATEDWQKAVQQGDGWARAEAWLAMASAYGDLGQADRSVDTFIAMLSAYPDLVVPAERRAQVEAERKTLLARIDKALAGTERVSAHTSGIDLAGLPDVGVPDTYGERAAEGVAAAAILGASDGHSAIAALRDIANREKDLPVLPALARNEIGDLYVRLGDVESANLEYQAVAGSNADARQVQRAHLSAAKALLVAGHYEQAVTALGPPPASGIPGGPGAALARRARKAYVKTLLAKADEEYRSKDLQLARKSYRAVLAVDAREVRAHRGLIACYAGLGEADRASKIYEAEAERTPDDPLIRYGVGLAYSYRTPEATWLPKAETELKRAVFLDDGQVFPHQTLGYVYEKEEELYGEKNGYERAADQYLLALSLNDVKEDYRNESDLLLNAGNAFFNLQNYTRAYEFYARREKADVPFDNPQREIVYLERIAKSAFESNRMDESVKRYDVALAYLDKMSEKDLPKKSAMEHRARLLDERAYAFDQARDPAHAAPAYLDAARANSIAGNEQNSARALRNAAIQLFEKGGSAADLVDKSSLVDAVDYLEQSLDDVEKSGVVKQPGRDKNKKHALFHYDMTFSMSLDQSEAVNGFSKEGEKELIFTFLGRIYDSLDDAETAKSYFEKKLSMLPKKVKAEQQASVDFKRALLENQIGVLAAETGDDQTAWDDFKSSYTHSLSIGNVHGGMTNAANLGLLALQTRKPEWIDGALETIADALSLLDHASVPDPERYLAALHAARGQLLALQASRLPSPAKSADPAAAFQSLQAALAAQAKQLAAAEKELTAARGAIDSAQHPTSEMNRERVGVLVALGRLAQLDGRKDDAAKRFAEAQKAANDRGMTGLAAQAAIEALGPDADPKKLDAALAALESVPAPILARELDLAGIEPWYRILASRALAAGDAKAALAAMERLRGLQVVARSGGAIPKGHATDVAKASAQVDAAAAALRGAWAELSGWTGPVTGADWQAKKDAFTKAVAGWNAAVEGWGSWDETAWTLAHPGALDLTSLYAALPSDGAFVYFIATGDALWTIGCADGDCTAKKAGPSPAADPAGARAAAAKAVAAAAAALPAGARVQIVPDAGLYDVAAWLDKGLYAGRVIAVQMSAGTIVAADSRRAPYRERQDIASTAGAINLLNAAPHADVLRLDLEGKVPAGRPLSASWELTSPDGPAPIRRITARDVLVAGGTPALIAADVSATADPETLLALADLWVRGGAGTVAFFPAAASSQADAIGRGQQTLAGAPTLLVEGHPGMTPEELKSFGDETVGSTIDMANAAANEKRWDDEMAGFDRALYLIDALKVQGPKTDLLTAQTVAAYNAAQWTRGERYATELVQAYEEAKESGTKYAEALVLQGIMQQRAEHYDAAVATLAKAEARYKELGSPDGVARSLTNLGAAYEKKLDAPEAVDTFRKAIAVQDGLGKTAGVGDLERKIGRMYYAYLEDYAQASEHFAAARDAYVKAKDPKGEDEARMEIGLVADRRGMLDEAKKAYQEVYDRAVARKDVEIQTKAAIFLSNNAWLSGDYQTAFARIREARRMAEQVGDARFTFLTRSGEGLIYWTLNDLDRATSLQKESLELVKPLASPIDEASTWNNLGIIYRSAARYPEAVDSFQQALAIDRKIGSKWGQAYDLRNLGLTYLLSADIAKAGEPLQEAVDLAASIGDKVNGAKAVLALADFHHLQGDSEKAKALYSRALEQATASHLPEVTWRAHRGLGAVAKEKGDVDTARKELDLALQVVEDLRGAIKVEELKNGFIADKLDLYDDAIELALDNPAKGSDKALVSWAYSERSRARSFIDLLANRKVELSSPADNARLDEQRALKDKIFLAEDAVAKANDDQRAERVKTLTALREQYRDLLVEIRAANPKLSAFVTVEPPSLADVRKVLGADTALLEYHVAAKETIVWTITDQKIAVTRIPVGRTALAAQVKDYLGKLEAIRPVDADERTLFKSLVEPALADAKGKRYLGIVPHGALHYVPFAALKGGDDYLVDRFALFYVPSAAVLPLTLGRTPESTGDKSDAKVLAIGNPDLGDPSFSLPFAELEVGDLKLDFPQIDVMTRERATDSWVVKNIGNYRVIHFACHGEFDPVNPLFSSLRLAKGSGSTTDGALAAHEIFGLPLKAELVTLSACQTGLGKIEAGDELIGLNRAFLYAGTRSIMSTLWRVHDGSTAVLVKHFYRGYAREGKADALRDAMRQVRDYYPHPAYWAAFALTGEYR